MARQPIFVGANANDGTGDTLRVAMQKVNDNFAELYASNELEEDTTPKLAGNLDTQNFIITNSTTNGNITLTPNGTGSVMAGSLKINGTTLSSDDSSKITLAETVDILNNLNVTGILNAPRIETNIIDSYDSSVISILRDTNILGNLSLSSINSNDSSQLSINDSVAIAGNLTVDNVNAVELSTEGVNIINNEISATRSNDDLVLNGAGTGQVRIGGYRFPTGDGSAGQVLTTNGAGQLYFSSSGGAGAITFRSDDSSTVNVATNTVTFSGTNGIDIFMDQYTGPGGDPKITFSGPDLSSYLTNSTITVVGDDSTGTTLNSNETIKFAGATGISTAVSGDTLTITGTAQDFAFGSLTGTPTTLSGYGITDAVASGSTAIQVVGDDSTGTSFNIGETLKIAGGTGITTAVSADTITITATSSAITFVGDDSTGTLVSGGETFRIAGSGGITTTVVGDTITIDGSSVSGGSIGDLAVVGSTIISPSNANLTLTTAGTGIIDLDTNRVNIGSDYSSMYLGGYERYEYGLTSLTAETINLGSFSNKDSVYGNTLGANITLDQTDPGSLVTNQWKGLRVELITDVNGRSVSSFNQINGVRAYNGGANALSVLNQFRNNNTVNPDHTLVESAGISVLTNFAHDNSVSAKTTITDYSSVVTNLDTAFSTGTSEITNHYQFLANGSRKSNATGTGTLINEYGLYIKNNSVATNKYGVYVENESFINRIGGLQITSRNITTTESNQDITINPNGSGYVYLSGFRFPNVDGASNQVLQTNGAGVLSFVTPNVIEMVGDDSTGTTIRMGETFKISGGTNINTAVSGDVMTITGSNSIVINSITSTDSSAIQINDAVNISGDLSANIIDTNQIGSSDSSAIQITNSINVNGDVTGTGAGSFGGNLNVGGNASITGNITIDGTLNSTGTLTSNIFVVNQMSSDDSTAIQINDSVNVSGTLTVGTLVASTISPPSTLTGTYTISSPTTITLDPTDEVINTAPMRLVNKTVSQLTTSPGITASTGALVYCTDDVAGGVPAFFDGTSWRRITDRAVVTT